MLEDTYAGVNEAFVEHVASLNLGANVVIGARTVPVLILEVRTPDERMVGMLTQLVKEFSDRVSCQTLSSVVVSSE